MNRYETPLPTGRAFSRPRHFPCPAGSRRNVVRIIGCLLICCTLICLATGTAYAANYLLNGGQESVIHYRMTQQVTPAEGSRKLTLSYVIPTSFASPTFQQNISGQHIEFVPAPKKRRTRTDRRGNQVLEAEWTAPLMPVTATIHLTARNSVRLTPLTTQAPFPLRKLPSETAAYIEGSDMVDIRHPGIQTTARRLTAGARTQFDAVQQVLTWVVDHMQYILTPPQFDATYTFDSGRGNCQNYSHLTAALLRAAGIPVRIVNGITLKQPYDIHLEGRILTMKMAEGRHSWIEVFFPGLGWVPFDPQITEMFVSNRFIRVEVGMDNRETSQDGLIRWTQLPGSDGRPQYTESIIAEFAEDSTRIAGRETGYGPQKLLLCPPVEAAFAKVATAPPPPLPEKIDPAQLQTLRLAVPYVFGNLDFPQNVDFLQARKTVHRSSPDSLEMRRNFLVETAEYVTTQGRQYAQIFLLDRPLLLDEIGLALHKFSDDGQLWVELLADDQGQPGEVVAVSELVSAKRIPYSGGYDWVNFDFRQGSMRLSPGRYWIALGFTGSAVVNWFFTYGKPVGPADGTRYRSIFDPVWSRSLAFEFNYRVAGRTQP